MASFAISGRWRPFGSTALPIRQGLRSNRYLLPAAHLPLRARNLVDLSRSTGIYGLGSVLEQLSLAILNSIGILANLRANAQQ